MGGGGGEGQGRKCFVLRFVTTVQIFSMIVLRCEYATVSTILRA